MKGYMLGFGAVLVLVGAGVDYDSLSRSRGLALGQMSAADYVNSIPDRFNAYRADQATAEALAERQAVPARDHLGAAADGWTRRDWTIDDEAALHGLTPDQYAAWKKSLQKGTFATGAAATMSPTDQKRKARQTYVYQNGPQIIEVIATFEPAADPDDAPAGGVGALVTSLSKSLKAQTKKQGFAFVDGVAYVDDRTAWKDTDTPNTVPFLTLEARLGDQIMLKIRARSSDAAVRQVIDAVDHDALNAMLDTPFPDVGSQNPALDIDGQIALADLHLSHEQARDAALLAEYKAQLDQTGKVEIVAPLPRDTIMDDAMRAEMERQLAARGETMPPLVVAPAKDVTSAQTAATRQTAEPLTPREDRSIARPDATATVLNNAACTTENGIKRCRVSN